MKTWQKVLLFAVLPALIAGGFSIAPKVYEEITQPRASLAYNMTAGPAIRVGSSYQQIFSMSITNVGKAVLTEIAGTFLLSEGKIETFAFEDTNNINPKVTIESERALVEIPLLHPTEEIKLSVLVDVPNTSGKPNFVLRSREVLGQITSLPTELLSEKRPVELLGSVLAAVSVFLMSFFVLRSRGSPLGVNSTKQDTLVYIAALARVKEINEEVRLSSSLITYLRMADLFLAVGHDADDEIRSRCIIGLKSLLLIEWIASLSVEVITHNLEILEGDEFEAGEVNLLREKADKIKNTLALRKNIKEFCENPTVFLTS